MFTKNSINSIIVKNIKSLWRNFSFQSNNCSENGKDREAFYNYLRDGYQREWDLCRAEKIIPLRQTGWISSIKDDSYNILASLTATSRYTCNGNYSKTEFHDFLPLSREDSSYWKYWNSINWSVSHRVITFRDSARV